MKSAEAKRHAALTVLVLTLLTAPPSARGESHPEGIWQGTLQGMLRVVVHIERGPTGSLTGTLDSPDQGRMGLPIDTVIVAGDSLRFEMKRIRGDFAGVMKGKRLVGRWRQGGIPRALSFERVEKAAGPPLRPQEPQRPFPYDTAAVIFDNTTAGIKLAGTLTLPSGAGPFPCALLITGSGPEDRDETVVGHRPFLVLADHLTRQGIAVLRVDDRGVGGSTGRFSDATSEDFAGDVLAGIDFLKTRAEIDRTHIGLIGHSEGGLIAPIVATRSKDVAFIVLMAGPGVPGDSTLLLQSVAIRRSMGVSKAYVAKEASLNRRRYAQLRDGDSVGVVQTGRELVALQMAELSDEQRKRIGDPDSTAAAVNAQFFRPWMRFFLTYDPRPTLQKVRCPVLAINGGKDLQVLPKEHLAAIETALKAGGGQFVVKELPGLNHLFQTCKLCTVAEYRQLEETMAKAALEEISRWILAQTTVTR